MQQTLDPQQSRKNQATPTADTLLTIRVAHSRPKVLARRRPLLFQPYTKRSGVVWKKTALRYLHLSLSASPCCMPRARESGAGAQECTGDTALVPDTSLSLHSGFVSRIFQRSWSESWSFAASRWRLSQSLLLRARCSSCSLATSAWYPATRGYEEPSTPVPPGMLPASASSLASHARSPSHQARGSRDAARGLWFTLSDRHLLSHSFMVACAPPRRSEGASRRVVYTKKECYIACESAAICLAIAACRTCASLFRPTACCASRSLEKKSRSALLLSPAARRSPRSSDMMRGCSKSAAEPWARAGNQPGSPPRAIAICRGVSDNRQGPPGSCPCVQGLGPLPCRPGAGSDHGQASNPGAVITGFVVFCIHILAAGYCPPRAACISASVGASPRSRPKCIFTGP